MSYELDILQDTARRYPRAFDHAHVTGDPERYDFIILAAKALYAASGGLIGGNWRRGVVGDLSADGLSYIVDGQYYFADVIRSAKDRIEQPQGELTFNHDPANLLRDASGRYIGAQGFADPRGLNTAYNYGAPTPIPPEPPQPPQPVCKFQPTDLGPIQSALVAVVNLLAEIRLEVQEARDAARNAGVAASLAQDAAEKVLAEDNEPIEWPEYTGRVPTFGGTVTLRPKI